MKMMNDIHSRSNVMTTNCWDQWFWKVKFCYSGRRSTSVNFIGKVHVKNHAIDSVVYVNELSEGQIDWIEYVFMSAWDEMIWTKANPMLNSNILIIYVLIKLDQRF